MGDGLFHSIDISPQIHGENGLFVRNRYIFQLAVDRGAGIVDSGVEAAELLDGDLCDVVYFVGPGDIGSHVNRALTGDVQLLFQPMQGIVTRAVMTTRAPRFTATARWPGRCRWMRR